MTYAELSEKMSSTEMELWMALDMVRQDECPNCGIEPIDLMSFGVVKVKCPVCKHEHGKVKRWESSMSVLRSGD